MKIPKMPKGLMTRVRKEEAKNEKIRKVEERKKVIAAAKARLEKVREANRNKKPLPKKK